MLAVYCAEIERNRFEGTEELKKEEDESESNVVERDINTWIAVSFVNQRIPAQRPDV